MNKDERGQKQELQFDRTLGIWNRKIKCERLLMEQENPTSEEKG